jgi:hypothetical protein
VTARGAFCHDSEMQVLLETDAVGEGINLQRAHLTMSSTLWLERGGTFARCSGWSFASFIDLTDNRVAIGHSEGVS